MKLLPLCLLALVAGTACAQEAPPKREFRAAWIATVTRLDWPPTGTTQDQKASLIYLLDELARMHINAVFFQVRSEADAMYASTIEPWSYWLTEQQGKAPSPAYDPLAFAVEEAHKRGMELHAWFNPYRVERSIGNYATDSLHVTKKHPDWIIQFSQPNIAILDPGKQAVRDYNTRVIMDVVRRYDIDGVHFDDYFYPYPNGGVGFSGITNQDDATFAAEGRGFTNRGDWRRDNVNLFIKQVGDSIRAVKPHVKYGVSPFGIWKPGVPSGTTGLDAYNTIYADGVAWLRAQSIDYITPQLYWAFGGGQDYGRLASWWRDRAQENGRHLYPGHAAYRGVQYSNAELPRQVRFNRANGIPGSVFFRTGNLVYNSNAIEDSLRQDLYRTRALPPVMPWKETLAPPPPLNLTATASGPSITLTWQAPAVPAGDGEDDGARWFALYRFGAEPALPGALDDAAAIIAVLPATATSFADAAPLGGPNHYVLTALDANWNESAPSGDAVATGAETGEKPGSGLGITGLYPNPSAGETRLQFVLGAATRVRVRLFNALGQEVLRVLDDAPRGAGPQAVSWTMQGLPAGVYLVAVEAGGKRATRHLTHVE